MVVFVPKFQLQVGHLNYFVCHLIFLVLPSDGSAFFLVQAGQGYVYVKKNGGTQINPNITSNNNYNSMTITFTTGIKPAISKTITRKELTLRE
ncbi:hypothetical protein ASL11_15055 [Paenibacillus sp. Soil750]|nr:hypothetical protein ASL11_15055 [Paenibacillus sp. Soil750]